MDDFFMVLQRLDPSKFIWAIFTLYFHIHMFVQAVLGQVYSFLVDIYAISARKLSIFIWLKIIKITPWKSIIIFNSQILLLLLFRIVSIFWVYKKLLMFFIGLRCIWFICGVMLNCFRFVMLWVITLGPLQEELICVFIGRGKAQPSPPGLS